MVIMDFLTLMSHISDFIKMDYIPVLSFRLD